MKGVYIGAWTDTVHLNLDFNEFVMIDTEPASDGQSMSKSKPFFDYLIQNYADERFELVERKTNYFLFKRNNQKAHYFYNTHFPNDLTDDLVELLCDFDFIYYSGFSPDKSIMDYANTPIEFYGSSNTGYLYENDEHKLDVYLDQNPQLVSKWYLVYCEERADDKGGDEFLGEIDEFDTFNKFRRTIKEYYDDSDSITSEEELERE